MAPRPSRPTAEPLREGPYGEILARITAIDDRVTAIGGDAREARDGVLQLTAGLDAQGIPAKIAELHGDIERGLDAARSDLVNASANIKRELREKHEALAKRVGELETFKHRVDGATGVLGWLAKNAPWLLSIALGILAAIGFRDKLS